MFHIIVLISTTILTSVEPSAFFDRQRSKPYYPRSLPMTTCYGRDCQPTFIDDAIVMIPQISPESSNSANDELMEEEFNNVYDYMYPIDDTDVRDPSVHVDKKSGKVLEKIFGGSSNRTDDEEVYAMKRESHYHKVQCACESKYVKHDLGIDYFPRYYLSQICTQKSECWVGGRCREKYYKITVLRRKSSDTPEIRDTRIQKPPMIIRNMFTSEHVKISVGCNCVLC